MTVRAASEPKFAQQNEAPRAVLAMLRVEPEPAQQNASDIIPAVAAPAEPPASAPVPDQREEIAALNPQDATPPEAMNSEIPVPETSVRSEAAPAAANAPAPASEQEIAAAEPVVAPANEAAPPASEQASVPAPPDTGTAATKVAALGDQAAAVKAQPSAKAVAKPDRSVLKKRLQARRAKERRRLAQRARLARQAAAQQQAADPFAQPTIATRSR